MGLVWDSGPQNHGQARDGLGLSLSDSVHVFVSECMRVCV